WIADRRGVRGERDHLFALQQPTQAGAVASRQPVVGGVRPLRRLVEAEQVARVPTKPLSCFAPLVNECPAITDCHPPPVLGDVGRGSQLEMSESRTIAQACCRDLDDGDFGTAAVRSARGCPVSRSRPSRLRLRQEPGAFLVNSYRPGRGIERPQVAPGTAHRTKRVFSQTCFVCRTRTYERNSVDFFR